MRSRLLMLWYSITDPQYRKLHRLFNKYCVVRPSCACSCGCNVKLREYRVCDMCWRGGHYYS
jgi:hypothetical protein